MRVGGHRQVREGVETLLRYRIVDENGAIIRDPRGYPRVEDVDGETKVVEQSMSELCPIPGIT